MIFVSSVLPKDKLMELIKDKTHEELLMNPPKGLEVIKVHKEFDWIEYLYESFNEDEL